jgi:hypothetical protein
MKIWDNREEAESGGSAQVKKSFTTGAQMMEQKHQKI